jgi:hypothetical protein
MTRLIGCGSSRLHAFAPIVYVWCERRNLLRPILTHEVTYSTHIIGAGLGSRTLVPRVEAESIRPLYESRMFGGTSWNRTNDLWGFKPPL